MSSDLRLKLFNYFSLIRNSKTIAPGAHAALIQIASEVGNMTPSEAEKYIKELHLNFRYQDDVF